MTTDHEGDEVFEQLRAEHHGLIKDLAANLDLDAGVADALNRREVTTDHPSTGTVEVPAPDEVHDDIHIWAGGAWDIVAPSSAGPDRVAFYELPDVDPDGPTLTADQLRQLAGQALAAAYLLDHGHCLIREGAPRGDGGTVPWPDWAGWATPADSSPDPEGAVAREVAPDSDTAAAAEPFAGETPWGAGSDRPARIRVGDGPFYTGVRRADDPVDSGAGAMTDERLADVLDGLHAYDMGATDSGIKDEELRAAALAELAQRPPGFVDWIVWRLYLTPEAQASGYSEEDADDFREWLGDQIVLAPDSDTARETER